MNTAALIGLNLAGIPDARWSERAERCGDCLRPFAELRVEVPLLLWRKGGDEMLKLCWDCATKRMARRADNIHERL